MTIRLRTEIPGPRSKELLERRLAAIPRGVSQAIPIFAARTQGASIVDVDDNVLLDFAAGIGVLNVGANRPEVVDAVRTQAGLAMHTCFHVTMNEPYLKVAEALNRMTPGDFTKKTLLLNAGVEAVENAVKIARRFTGRPAVIAFSHAFHGRTLLGLTLTAKVSTYKSGFGPFAPEVYRLPACDLYRSPFATVEQTVRWTLDNVRSAIDHEIGKDKVAAMIIEPVQGEGGFIPQPSEFLRGLREIADEYGIVLIVDEIQTGFGRTGRLYAIEESGVVPDLILSAKSLADGLPLSAVTGRSDIMDAAQVGGLGGTYGGNPLACAAALEVIRIMEQGDLIQKARELGVAVTTRFRALQRKFEAIGDVRGVGAMVALEFVRDRRTKEPDPVMTEKVHRLAYERGLILMRAGDHGSVIRFLAALTVTAEELREGLDVLESAIADVSAGRLVQAG